MYIVYCIMQWVSWLWYCRVSSYPVSKLAGRRTGMWCTPAAEEKSWTGKSPPHGTESTQQLGQAHENRTITYKAMCTVYKQVNTREQQYLVIGEEIFERGCGWEVRQRRDDSEDKTLQVWSHKRTLVLYGSKPARKTARLGFKDS